MGESVKKFETAFANKLEVPYAVMVSSGSMANLVALASLFYKKDKPLQRGDERDHRRRPLVRFTRS